MSGTDALMNQGEELQKDSLNNTDNGTLETDILEGDKVPLILLLLENERNRQKELRSYS